MIRSMTAFSRKQSQENFGTLMWEIRSVNNRYLDLHLRLPDACMELEPALRQVAKNHLKRGKVDCTFRYNPVEIAGELRLNQSLASSLTKTSIQLMENIGRNCNINVTDIMRWPGVLQYNETYDENLPKAVLKLFEDALIEVDETKIREGAKLKDTVLQRLKKMESELKDIQIHIPEMLNSQRQILLARIKELGIQIDNDRLEQELLILAQKIDIEEEVDRLQIHIEELRRLLNGEPEAVGRRLDFLMQELNRESNTISSKSNNHLITQRSIELKVLTEQMREQIQNIE